MIKKIKKNRISENEIIYNYLKKLSFNKSETFNFKNDGALLKKKQYKDLVVTNDTIVETIDFFKNDPPESIAQKIITYNLSDISSMGADPYSYTLSLSFPNYINHIWIKKFTDRLFNLQKRYNFFLIGGDISKSNKIHISSNFYGYVKKELIIKREFPKIGDAIWVTGNFGDSHIGLLLKKNKLKINKFLKKYFISRYHYPEPCLIGSKIVKIANCGIDVSDGFLGDLSKLLNNKFGADLFFSKIPFSKNALQLINNKIIDPISLLNGGDDYELIFTCSNLLDDMIQKIANKQNYKISKVGRITNKSGISLDGKKIKNSSNSFQYFF